MRRRRALWAGVGAGQLLAERQNMLRFPSSRRTSPIGWPRTRDNRTLQVGAGSGGGRSSVIKRLDEQARRLERSGPSVDALFAEERARSHQYGGRSVFGAEPPLKEAARRTGERSQ